MAGKESNIARMQSFLVLYVLSFVLNLGILLQRSYLFYSNIINNWTKNIIFEIFL